MRCPCGHRTSPAQESSMFFISYRTRVWPARVPWHNHNWQKSRTGVVSWPYGARTGPLRSPHGLFTISKPVWDPSVYNACIKTLQAPYGEAKFILHRTGPVRAPWVDVQFLFKTAREQPIRAPGVWCDWGINVHWLVKSDWLWIKWHDGMVFIT